LDLSFASWISCGILPEAYLLATSTDAWYINSLRVQIDNGPVRTVFNGGLTPGKQQTGIWLDDKPYTTEEGAYEPALRDPSDGWVINLFQPGEFYALKK